MNIIGIDLGLTAGVSCYSENESKIIDFKNISKPRKNDMPYSLYFKNELHEFCTKYSPCIVLVETLPIGMHTSVHAVQKLSVLADTVVTYCYENNIIRIGYNVQSIKKHYCKIPNARKDEVRTEMLKRGIELPTDQSDIVDSIALIYYHLDIRGQNGL